MQNLTHGLTDVPYHLRASRLRWAAFAVTLDQPELVWIKEIQADSEASAHTKLMAELLFKLHNREDISTLCGELHVSRRKLLEMADKLTTKEGRRLLLSQPQRAPGRPRKNVKPVK